MTIRPPSHPFSLNVSQSIKFCSDNGTTSPRSLSTNVSPLTADILLSLNALCSSGVMSLNLSMAMLLSIEPMAEKAQHAPHRPWFRTGPMRPLKCQSMPPLSSGVKVDDRRRSVATAAGGAPLSPPSCSSEAASSSFMKFQTLVSL